ncbi:MAG TPA: DNA-formamidopyrimidine glycosylase family protein [bacterium]|nr:DNA-formamidopyrimidine glycosylase family protein [bacterium]
MAEGPLVHRVAKDLSRVLKGKRVRVEFGVKRLKPFEASLAGVAIKDVEAYGKQFRIRLADGRVILVHLMMWGWWRIYAKGEAWERPPERARLVLRTAAHDVVAFSAPVVRLFARGELEADPVWGRLGPDPLRRDFSAMEFFRRLEAEPKRKIGDMLLDQHVISGVGNIIKIEALFGARVHPRRPVASLSRAEKERLLTWVLKLMAKWLKERGNEDTWIRIYRKSSQPCLRCGGKVERFRQSGRITYACSECQPLRPGRRPGRGRPVRQRRFSVGSSGPKNGGKGK